MRMPSIAAGGALLLVIGLFGCTTARPYATNAPPGELLPALLAGQNVAKWEYACALAGKADAAGQLLKEASEKGWELVTVNGSEWCFKRPVAAVTSP